MISKTAQAELIVIEFNKLLLRTKNCYQVKLTQIQIFITDIIMFHTLCCVIFLTTKY